MIAGCLTEAVIEICADALDMDFDTMTECFLVSLMNIEGVDIAPESV